MSSRSARVLLGLWCILLFAIGAFFYTRQNTFPIEFHPDEAPKAIQAIQARPTYRQPLLLTTTTAIATRLTARTASVQQAVFTGRDVSAVFAAGTLVLLSLFGYAIHRRSLRAAVIVGVAALSCPQLLLLAHYMKEDTALVFAVAAFLLAVWFDEQRATRRSAVLLGTTAAMVASAKYIGLAAIPVGYWLVVTRPSSDKSRRTRALVLSAAVCWCAINYLVIANPLRFVASLSAEVAHPVAGHHGLANAMLIASPIWKMLATQINPFVAAAAVGFLVFCTHKRRRLPRALVLFTVGSVTYLLLLSASRFVLDRHLLPVTLATYTMAGLAAVEITNRIKAAGARWISTVVFCAALVVSALSPARAILHELENETRVQLRTWIRNNLPAAAVIAQDRPAHLDAADARFPVGQEHLPQKLLTPREFFVTDLGSLDELKAQGVTHVVTCDEAYSRLFTDQPTSAEGRADYDRRRARYQEIFSSATLLFEAKPARPIGGNTSPDVRVYAISK